MTNPKQRYNTWRNRHLRKALAIIQADRTARAVVILELSQSMVEDTQDWSIPLQVRFHQANGQWQMQVRDPAVVHRKAVAQRAARQ